MQTYTPIIFDAVVCVASHHMALATKSIKSLCLFSNPRNVLIVTAKDNFPIFEKLAFEGYPLLLKDEDRLCREFNLLEIQRYLISRGANPHRAGWYFQQFLKMGIYALPELAECYLIWDGDTIMLQPLTFFDPDNTVLINPQSFNHRPMHEVTKKILGVNKEVDFSFIAEHFMVKKSYMADLVQTIEMRSQKHQCWVWTILDSIDDVHLSHSGFSEYETYGNFIHAKYPNSYHCRPIASLRAGAKIFGHSPNAFDLYTLSKNYTYATFEFWQKGNFLKILNHKAHSISTFFSDNGHSTAKKKIFSPTWRATPQNHRYRAPKGPEVFWSIS